MAEHDIDVIFSQIDNATALRCDHVETTIQILIKYSPASTNSGVRFE